MGLLDKIFGSKNQKIIKKVQPLVNKINSLEEEFSLLDEITLKSKRNEFIDRFNNGESLDSMLPEAFATVREVSKRQLGLRHYDCQLIGGIALHNCQIAEMATGEGKTLVATLPSYLNSITQRKVVLVTVNDYLAKRDAEWMKPIYQNLDMEVAFIIPGQQLEERKKAYEADVIYATNNELGFDFLRNNMVVNTEDRMMSDYYFAIIDEVDSILIDEARTPLVISGPAENTAEIYQKISKFIPKLEEQIVDEEIEVEEAQPNTGHFIIDEKSKQVELTDVGHDFIENLLKGDNLLEDDQSLYSSGNLRLLHYIQSSLRAHFLFHKDIDYMVQERQVVLIDENTGRAMPGRRLADGLHQAIEQKENVPIQMESQTLASCTFQNYFRQYEKLSGMTGTASTEAEEFAEIYGLNVLEVPTNEPMIRDDKNDLVYLTQSEKYKAVIEEIQDFKAKGNPILVGTASLESSELLSGLLKKEGLEHQVLNAKNHAKEAEIISQAGKPGVVTIATNMAGRGTDIVLGGNWEAENEKLNTDSDKNKKEELKNNWLELNKSVLDSGGLHVIGTERNESRRMDNQLRGRSGRQGDPGSSRFYISLEDNLMRIFASDQFKNIMQRVGLEDGESIEHRMLSGAIERAQKRVEGRNFDIRKMLLEYDDMANEQRQIIYSQRNSILEADVITELLDSMRETVVSDEIDTVTLNELEPHEWNVDILESSLSNIFGLQIPIKEWVKNDHTITREGVENKILVLAKESYKQKSNTVGSVMRDFEKQILLQIIDSAWKDHLAEVDALRQGIGLRSYASKNPKLEFRRESFELFENLLNKIRLEGIRFLSRVEIELEDSGGLNLPKQNQEQSLDHQSPMSALSPTPPEESASQGQAQGQGNRRLRRAEAKMAKKNSRKK